jgi:hypothetical protein
MEMTSEQVTQCMLENMRPWPQTGVASRAAGVVQTSGIVPAKGETNMSVISEFDAQVLAAMKTFGISRLKAVVWVAKQNPELHSAYVAATDKAFKAAQGRK